MKFAFMLSLMLEATILAQGQPLPMPDKLHALLQQANTRFSLVKQVEEAELSHLFVHYQLLLN